MFSNSSVYPNEQGFLTKTIFNDDISKYKILRIFTVNLLSIPNLSVELFKGSYVLLLHEKEHLLLPRKGSSTREEYAEYDDGII